mmetsp:Transcript_46095/g.85976  ORF Transcript_46095/g.85976 Transcript_46095/m.85976 type:complete len:157 (+) Transcript_46095:63-533(+)
MNEVAGSSDSSEGEVDWEEDIYLDNESEMPRKPASSSTTAVTGTLRRRTGAAPSGAREAPPRKQPAQAEGGQDDEEYEEDEEEDEEARKRRLQEGRTDIFGLDGCALFCFIWLVTTGVLFSLLYFSIFARDRHFFAPLQRTKVGKFFHGGVAALVE